MNCDRCAHAGVCRFEEASRNYESAYKLTNGNGKPDNIEVEFRCNKFQMKYATAKNLKK